LLNDRNGQEDTTLVLKRQNRRMAYQSVDSYQEWVNREHSVLRGRASQ
jgi:hypothetical protein